jgi:hypothetical protein
MRESRAQWQPKPTTAKRKHSQVKPSDQTRPDQTRPGQVRSGQIRSAIDTCHVVSCQCALAQQSASAYRIVPVSYCGVGISECDACDTVVTCSGVVWCGVVWCGVVWCGVVWCGVVLTYPPSWTTSARNDHIQVIYPGVGLSHPPILSHSEPHRVLLHGSPCP